MSEWIRCADRLPPFGMPVLGAIYHTDMVFAEDGETMAEAFKRTMQESRKRPHVTMCYLSDDGWNEMEGWPMVCAPSCWRELPEPPKWEDIE